MAEATLEKNGTTTQVDITKMSRAQLKLIDPEQRIQLIGALDTSKMSQEMQIRWAQEMINANRALERTKKKDKKEEASVPVIGETQVKQIEAQIEKNGVNFAHLEPNEPFSDGLMLWVKVSASKAVCLKTRSSKKMRSGTVYRAFL